MDRSSEKERYTLYIVPATTDHGTQCRVVRFNGVSVSPRDSYRAHPELWAEAGLVNSRGELVCLAAGPLTTREIKECEPLMAGSSFEVTDIAR